MKRLVALCLFASITAHAAPVAGVYQGVDARSLPCQVLVAESGEGQLSFSVHTRAADARAVFSAEAEALTAQVDVYKADNARAVVGLGQSGALEIIAMTAQGQRVECGSLELR